MPITFIKTETGSPHREDILGKVPKQSQVVLVAPREIQDSWLDVSRKVAPDLDLSLYTPNAFCVVLRMGVRERPIGDVIILDVRYEDQRRSILGILNEKEDQRRAIQGILNKKYANLSLIPDVWIYVLT